MRVKTFFRGLCPGLIEARRGARSSSCVGVFFRGLCPGLIEAGLPVDFLSVSTYRFSGVYAPASLKPPPRLRPVRGPARCFSGVYAPASLKRVGRRVVPVAAFAFFRGLCPGLIEARSTAATAPRENAFFRGLCPGLIEAVVNAYLNGRRMARFSGVYAPASLKHF